MNTTPKRRKAFSMLAVGTIAVFGLAACGDDDDDPSGTTSVDVQNSEVTATSVVSVGSDVTTGEVVTSEVAVTEVETNVSEVTVGGAATTGG